MKLNQIAKILELEVANDKEINGINTLKDAKSDEITFFHNKKYLKDLPSTKAGAILIEKKFSEYIPKGVEPLFTDEPYLKLAILSKYFAKPLIRDKDISISNTAQIEKNVVIGGGSSIGDNTLIMSGAVIGSDVKIGKNCIIYPKSFWFHLTSSCYEWYKGTSKIMKFS